MVWSKNEILHPMDSDVTLGSELAQEEAICNELGISS